MVCLLSVHFFEPGAGQSQHDPSPFIRHFYDFMRGGSIRQRIEDQFAGHLVCLPARGLHVASVRAAEG